MKNHIETHLTVPEQTLSKHSLFATTKDSVQKWLNTLPRANLGETTRQLYIALVELNKVNCSAKERLLVLEEIRHQVHLSNLGLEKHYLNKAIILPEQAKKVAQLSDTLNKQMAIGYTLAANQFLAMNRLFRPKDALAKSFHRAMTEHSLILLRNFQLYRNEDSGFWKSLHELFYQALKHNIAKETVSDDEWGNLTLEQAYLRPMLLFTARPHQLRQKTQAIVFKCLGEWSPYASVRSDQLDECIFVFNPTEDSPPCYRELCDHLDGWLGINTIELSQLISDMVEQAQNKQTLGSIDSSTLVHLHSAWGSMLQRNAVRIDREGILQVSLGLFSTHYFACHEQAFSSFMINPKSPGITPPRPMFSYGSQDKSYKRNSLLRSSPKRDVWSDATDTMTRDNHTHAEDLVIESISYENNEQKPVGSTQSTSTYRHYNTTIVNVSDTGYCVDWPTAEATKLQTGDILGLREEGHDDWSVGVIRWVKQNSDNQSQIGLELLAPATDAYSARQVKAGLATGDFQRALLLPANRNNDMPERILVQKTAFQEGDTIELIQPHQTHRVKLNTCLMSTSAISVFGFSDMVNTDSGNTHPDEQQEAINLSSTPAFQDTGRQDFDIEWEDL